MRTQFNKLPNKIKCGKSGKFLLFVFAVLFYSGCSLDGNYDPREGSPLIPSNPTPPDKAVDTELIITLQWEAQSISKFDLYLDTKNPPENIYAEDIETSGCNIYGIEPGTQYFWRVISKQENGQFIEGDVWSFTTKPEYTEFDGAILESKRVIISPPNHINIMLQVLDRNGRGITGYSINNFNIQEDGIPVAPIDSFASLKDPLKINYNLKTVLMIDNTVGENTDFEQIKAGALSFISNLEIGRQIKLYKFADDVELVYDFTSSKDALISAINSIEPEAGSTNLYGAAIAGSAELSDNYTPDIIEQSTLVIITAHDDSKSEFIFDEVLRAIRNKRVYIIGVGKNLEPFAISLIGNQEYFFADDSIKLEQKIIKTQSILSNLKNSFYWMIYNSPMRNDDFHRLNISIAGNNYSADNTEIEVSYLSSGFYTAEPGLYINSSSSNPAGFDTLTMFNGLTRTLTASTFKGDNEPYYTWYCADEEIVELTLTEENNRARVKAVGTLGQQTELLLTDLNNGLQKILTIIIE
jgi:hypothetical protein